MENFKGQLITDEEIKQSYTEVRCANDGRKPSFPLICPICGAPEVEINNTGACYENKIKYACGGGYSSKPQIQNHTNKWWGHCGLRDKLEAEENEEKSRTEAMEKKLILVRERKARREKVRNDMKDILDVMIEELEDEIKKEIEDCINGRAGVSKEIIVGHAYREIKGKFERMKELKDAFSLLNNRL